MGAEWIARTSSPAPPPALAQQFPEWTPKVVGRDMTISDELIAEETALEARATNAPSEPLHGQVQELSPAPEATNSVCGTRGLDSNSPAPQHVLLAPPAVKVTPPPHMRSLDLAAVEMPVGADLQPDDAATAAWQEQSRQRLGLAAAS